MGKLLADLRMNQRHPNFSDLQANGARHLSCLTGRGLGVGGEGAGPHLGSL